MTRTRTPRPKPPGPATLPPDMDKVARMMAWTIERHRAVWDAADPRGELTLDSIEPEAKREVKRLADVVKELDGLLSFLARHRGILAFVIDGMLFVDQTATLNAGLVIETEVSIVTLDRITGLTTKGGGA